MLQTNCPSSLTRGISAESGSCGPFLHSCILPLRRHRVLSTSFTKALGSGSLQKNLPATGFPNVLNLRSESTAAKPNPNPCIRDPDMAPVRLHTQRTLGFQGDHFRLRSRKPQPAPPAYSHRCPSVPSNIPSENKPSETTLHAHRLLHPVLQSSRCRRALRCPHR